MGPVTTLTRLYTRQLAARYVGKSDSPVIQARFADPKPLILQDIFNVARQLRRP
jgi:hypothetical protein